MKKTYVRNYYNKSLLRSIHSYYVSLNNWCESLYDRVNKNKSKYIYIEALIHIKIDYKENWSIKMKNISIRKTMTIIWSIDYLIIKHNSMKTKFGFTKIVFSVYIKWIIN